MSQMEIALEKALVGPGMEEALNLALGADDEGDDCMLYNTSCVACGQYITVWYGDERICAACNTL